MSGSFPKANEFAKKFRANEPAEYNPRRQFEQPIPSVEYEIERESDIVNAEGSLELNTLGSGIAEESGNGSVFECVAQLFEQNDTNNVTAENTVEHSFEPIGDEIAAEDINEQAITNACAQIESENTVEHSFEPVDDEIPETDMDQINTGRNVESDVKHTLHTVQMDERDETAINTVIENHADVITETHESDSIEQIKLAADEKAEMKNGNVMITKTFDDDLQMTYTFGKNLHALQPLYNIKMNDIISDNIPFKENVRRIYILKNICILC